MASDWSAGLNAGSEMGAHIALVSGGNPTAEGGAGIMFLGPKLDAPTVAGLICFSGPAPGALESMMDLPRDQPWVAASGHSSQVSGKRALWK